MNKKQIERLKEVIIYEEAYYSFYNEVLFFIDDEELAEIEDKEELRDYLEELDEDGDITDTEIRYYSNSMNYLKENDPSLQKSLEIARDLGYNLKHLNSELLASLLATEENKEDYPEFIDEVLEQMEDL